MIKSLTPSLLIAPPQLAEQPFNESVIILAGHKEQGSLGFILNRPIGITIKDLMDDFEEQSHHHTNKPVLFGGPVEKNAGFILYEHKSQKPLAPGFMVTKTLSISPARKLLEDAALGKLPGRFDLFLGYASWTKGQLWRELSKGYWMLSPFSKELLFDVPPEERWRSSFELLGLAPHAYIHVPGGAKA